ncbi:putative secondary metabolism biosynthetic enzyme [Elasticomyces elasticus]|nr:putative secondary metabolism biosynthetic enzyme [Elasticomyces elasticus]KAK4968570.1 hypothetical protein LTR42_009853 [Elasticomyces elasticus]
MSAPMNQAAWLKEANAPLEVGDAPMPTPGPGEIVVKNAALAINPLDWHMRDAGIFVQQWPTILGCDVAGEVFEVGTGVDRFKKGDRVIGHCTNLVSGRPSDGAYALYTIVLADKAAILPDHITFTDGVVVPFALETALCALCVREPGPCPSQSAGKILVVYGGSSSVGSMTTQIATAARIAVVAIAGIHNHDMVRSCGAIQVFDHEDSAVVRNTIDAVIASGLEFVGVFDSVCTPETYARDLEILEQLGGGHLACVHSPPVDGVPANVKTGMVFAVNDIATPVFKDWVTAALLSGQLKCLPPPVIVGKGLGFIDEALKRSKAGVSGAKLVVEL